jgi:hypothetical protein
MGDIPGSIPLGRDSFMSPRKNMRTVDGTKDWVMNMVSFE